MRISTGATAQNGVNLLSQLSASIAHIQEQISTGRRILTPAEDPAGAAQSLILRESISQLSQYSRNAGAAESRLQREETALTTITQRLQRVREIVLQASNATQNDDTRKFIAAEIRQNLDQLVQIANTRDGNGRYLFGGFSDQSPPFSQTGGNFLYNGDQGQRLIRIADQKFIPDGDSGDSVFMRIPRGNGEFVASAAGSNTGTGIVATQDTLPPPAYDGQNYTIRFIDPDNYEVLDSGGVQIATGAFQSRDSIEFNGISIRIDGLPVANDEFAITPSGSQDIFSTLEDIATALETLGSTEPGRAKLASELNLGLLNLDQGIGNVVEVRTRIGTRLGTIDSQVDTNEGFTLVAQSALANLEDLDYTAAIANLAEQLSALEAAQQSFVRIQGLSLFNVI